MEKTYKILKLVIMVLVLVAVLLGAKLLYDSMKDQVQMNNLVTESTVAPENDVSGQNTQPREETRKQVPDFTVFDEAGNYYRLSDFRGKPVILNFWASWCGPCKSEMPDFDEKYAQYGDQIHFLMVNLTDGAQETPESAVSYIREAGYSFPVYYDLEISAAYSYSVTSIPVTYFIDSEGYLEAWYPGAMSAETLQQGIDLLLASK